VEGTDMLNGEYAAMKGDWSFGDNCQYGGAIMYTSFYDLMARIDTNGKDDAFARLTAIQQWYQEVYDYYVANGSNPYDFYRYYYDNKGIQCQGMGEAGAVGLDREFLESFLPVSAVAYGFFGIEANGTTLEIAPELPEELDYWKMENLLFGGTKYDLTIFDNAVSINTVRGDAEGLYVQVVLDAPKAGEKVYINGVENNRYTIKDGKVYRKQQGQEEKLLEENYTRGETLYNYSYNEVTFTVGKGEIFYLGDNRTNSSDSRIYGCCTYENIVGVIEPYSLNQNSLRVIFVNFFSGIFAGSCS
jgi:hypothetical protein